MRSHPSRGFHGLLVHWRRVSAPTRLSAIPAHRSRFQFIRCNNQSGPTGAMDCRFVVARPKTAAVANRGPGRQTSRSFRRRSVFAGCSILGCDGIVQERWDVAFPGVQQVEARAVDATGAGSR